MIDDFRRSAIHKSIPAAPRAFAVGACILSAAFVAGALIYRLASGDADGGVSTWGLFPAAVFSAWAAILLLRGGAYIRVTGSQMELGLSPLRKVRFDVSEVSDLQLITVAELSREWGTRGRARGEDGLLFAIGGLRRALMFTLRDGRKFGVTVEGSEPEVLDILSIRDRISGSPDSGP